MRFLYNDFIEKPDLSMDQPTSSVRDRNRFKIERDGRNK